MRKSSTIAVAALAVLGLAGCRQEPTAKPVDTETEVTAQGGATPEPAATDAGTPAATDTAPAAGPDTPTANATPTPETAPSPAP